MGSLQRLQEDDIFITKILFTDKATFTNMDRYKVNLRNTTLLVIRKPLVDERSG